jgi:hypothetical protein
MSGNDPSANLPSILVVLNDYFKLDLDTEDTSEHFILCPFHEETKPSATILRMLYSVFFESSDVAHVFAHETVLLDSNDDLERSAFEKQNKWHHSPYIGAAYLERGV